MKRLKVLSVYFFTGILVLAVMVACGGGGGGGGGSAGGGDSNSAPIADVSGVFPITAFVGDEITLDGSGSADPDGSIEKWEWDLGNGSTRSGETTFYTYTTGGTYVIKLTVTDNGGKTDSATVEVTIQDGTPVADAGGPYGPALIGEEISFDGGASYDTNTGGNIESFEWNFGDGNTAAGETETHSYNAASAPETYTVTLTVTDNDGKTDSDTTEVRIHRAPIADAGTNKSAVEGDTVTFDGSASDDPDIDGSIEEYAWDWDNSGTYNDATGQTASNSWDTAGDYTVGLQVTDNDGATGTDTVEVTVVAEEDNLPPTADAGGPYDPVLLSDMPVSFDGSGSSDPDGTINDFEWTFGDGNSDIGETTTHTYSTVGDYDVTLTVTDDDATDPKTDSNTTSIRVHAEPTADINDSGNPEYVLNGEDFTLSASDSLPDGGAGPIDTIDEYRWDFDNDGTTDRTTSVPTVTHSYSSDGEKTIGLEVLDSSGVASSNEETYTLTVHQAVAADIGGPYTGSGTGNDNVFQIDDVISLNAGESSDPDSVGSDVIAEYAWDFDYDGLAFDNDATGETPDLDVSLAPLLNTPGNYTMALKVTDPDDASVTDIATLDYRINAPPEASFTHDPDDKYELGVGTYDALIDEVITFNASGSTDSDGEIVSYQWDFGDGTVYGPEANNGIEHSYDNAGSFIVELVVTDNDGAESTPYTMTIEVPEPGDVNVSIE